MLREGNVHANWCEMTMSMMREKQFEACERRLMAHPGVSLFSEQTTELDAQMLYHGSFEDNGSLERLVTLHELRSRVSQRLPLEALYISIGEMQLLERLLMNNGELELGEWDDIGAAEALVRRLWCSFHMDGERWMLLLPKALHAPLMTAISVPEAAAARERVFRYDATIHSLLYISGLLHFAQPLGVFMRDVMRMNDPISMQIARHYIQATFEYMTDAYGDLVLLHPGLADPYHLVAGQQNNGIFTLELTEELLAGGMNGILPEEIPQHEQMCGVLRGALRPEFDAEEAAEDLRILAKQGVSLAELEEVMETMLAVYPTSKMKDALERIHMCTPRWVGLKMAVMQ